MEFVFTPFIDTFLVTGNCILKMCSFLMGFAFALPILRLLAHFQPINLSQNQNCHFYEKKLKKYISNYHKNDCQLLKAHLNEEKIKIAIKHYPEIGQIPQKYFINSSKH